MQPYMYCAAQPRYSRDLRLAHLLQSALDSLSEDNGIFIRLLGTTFFGVRDCPFGQIRSTLLSQPVTSGYNH
jgi:hypothetical protein